MRAVCRWLTRYPSNVDTGSRIRLGFVSSFFHTHTLMQLFLGVIEGLPRSRYEIIIFDISARPDDDITRRVRSAASMYVTSRPKAYVVRVDAASMH